jgi:hypothetical protein
MSIIHDLPLSRALSAARSALVNPEGLSESELSGHILVMSWYGNDADWVLAEKSIQTLTDPVILMDWMGKPKSTGTALVLVEPKPTTGTWLMVIEPPPKRTLASMWTSVVQWVGYFGSFSPIR